MKRHIQQSFFKNQDYAKSFGGSLLLGRRKVTRPLATKVPIHLTLRSQHPQARKVFSYRSQRNRRILQELARKFNIQIFESVFNYTHLHLVIQIPHRKNYIAFIRQLSARLSRLAGLKKGELFALRPFTRVLSWGRGFKTAMNYMKKNYVEAIGAIAIMESEIGWDDA